MIMNSVLTVEEREFLRSLECENKDKAIEMLDTLRAVLREGAGARRVIDSLLYKLSNIGIDYGYEIRESAIFNTAE